MKIGDTIKKTQHGVRGTDIPFGATVDYTTGVDKKTINWTVVNTHCGKMLCLGDMPDTSGPTCCSPSNCIHGQNGPMTITSLPAA